jgi:hypothetical protein
MGSTVATVQACLFKKSKEEGHEGEGHHGLDESEHMVIKAYNELEEAKEGDEAITPGPIGPDGQPIRKVNCTKIIKRADAEIIKPLLIYNYESASHKKQKEYFDLMMKAGDKIEAAYAGGNVNTERKSEIMAVLNQVRDHGPVASTEVLDQHPSSGHILG